MQLPNSFKDFASTQIGGGQAPTTAFTTHCHWDLMHEQWKILLDDEFLEAWKHGIILLCPDGISQWFYPQIFTYSADYPEKWAINSPYKRNLQFICRILIVSIRNLGKCPCTHCLIPLSWVHCLGMTRDMSQRLTMACIDNVEQQGKVFAAQRLIYEKNSLVNSSAVEALLQDASWVLTSVCLTFY